MDNCLIRKISAPLLRKRNGKIAVRVKLKKSAEITLAKWGEGEQDARYFDKHGNSINCEKGSIHNGGSGLVFVIEGKAQFFVDCPGLYTIFVKDINGEADIATVAVKHSLPFIAGPVFATLLVTIFSAISVVTWPWLSDNTPKVSTGSKPAIVSEITTTSSGAAQIQKQEMVKDSLALSVSFASGSNGSVGTWQMANIKSNNVIMQAKIYIKGSPVATSPALRPGQSVKNIALQKEIEPGTYDATAYINYFNLTTQDYISSAGYHISVTVA